MSKKFFYEDYSGWFPFYLYEETDTSIINEFNSIGLSLTSLCKAYWLGKSFDWDINVNWSSSFQSATCIGSATKQIITPDFPLGSIPQERVTGIINFFGNVLPCGTDSDSSFAGGTTLENIIFTILGSPPITESASIAWFSITDIDTFPPIRVIFDSDNNFYSQCDFEVGIGSPLHTSKVFGEILTSVVFKIIVDGEESDPIPLYSSIANVSGTITINFNSFYN